MPAKLSTCSSPHAGYQHGSGQMEESPKPPQVKRSASSRGPVCCTCKIKKQKYMYVPPEKTPSFKPIKVYKPPCARLDGKTVYKMSYPGCDGETMKECREGPIIPVVNLVPGGKFSDQTTNKHDYIPWPGAVPADPVYPNACRLIGEGPISTNTTNRHDYTPKCLIKTGPIIPINNLGLSNKKMEDMSTMNASYQPIHKFDPSISFRPRKCYKPSTTPFEDRTVQKMSFVPHPVPEKEIYPWALKKPYEPPTIRFEDNTIYNNSYMQTPGYVRVHPIKHFDAAHLLTNKTNFEARTIYKESYKLNDDSTRPKPIIPHDNLTLSNAKLTNQTTQKHDYTPWPGATPADPVYPDACRLIGEGPMSNQTTQRHDYVPKPYFKTNAIIPQPNLGLSNKKMEDMSIMNASYQPVKNFIPSKSYAPKKCFKAPTVPVDNKTTQKLSFVPWPIPEKEDMPWARRGSYAGPDGPFDDNTVYNNSYQTPGTYVPIHEDECAFAAACENADQLCSYRGQCISSY